MRIRTCIVGVWGQNVDHYHGPLVSYFVPIPIFNSSECFISALSSYATLKFVYDIHALTFVVVYQPNVGIALTDAFWRRSRQWRKICEKSLTKFHGLLVPYFDTPQVTTSKIDSQNCQFLSWKIILLFFSNSHSAFGILMQALALGRIVSMGEPCYDGNFQNKVLINPLLKESWWEESLQWSLKYYEDNSYNATSYNYTSLTIQMTPVIIYINYWRI